VESLAWLPTAVPDAMAIVGADDEFRFVNAAWEALFGYREAELVGQQITALVGEGQIDDDGDGFDPPDGGPVPGHLGLTAMRERAQIAGGWWKMESRPGSGTSISFWLPGVQQAPEFMLTRLSG
jgi:PAS domain-containing protein